MKFPSKSQNNRSAVFLVGAVGGLGGSALTGLWIVSGVWAAILLMGRKIPNALTRSDLWLALAASVYFTLNVVAAVLNGASLDDVRVLYPIVVFLFPWLILPRLRLSACSDLIGTVALGAAFCGVLVLPLAAYQNIVLDIRAEGGSGNAIPFSMVTCFAAQLALLNLAYDRTFRKVLGWVGYMAGIACVLLSETKGLVPSMVLGPIVLLVLFPQARAAIFNWRSAALLLTLAAILAVLASPLYTRILESVLTLFGSGEDGSTSQRLLLWQRSFELIAESPFLGYGTQNRPDLVHAVGLPYAHFHNGFLNSAVDSGILGALAMTFLLVVPVIIAFRAKGTVYFRERLYVALVLTTTYILGGMTNYIFWHDIYDTQFLWIATLVAASVPISAFNPVIAKGKRGS